jgi:hypothetical protein
LKRTSLRANPEKVRAWQQRSRKPLKRTPKRTVPDRPKQTGSRGFSAKVRARIRRRSGGRCEAGIVGVCELWATGMHHRKLRRHGDHTEANGLHVCKSCHDEIHMHPAWSYEQGLLVRATSDPASVPVCYGAER